MCEHPQFVLGQPGADFLKIVLTVWDDVKFLDGAPDSYAAIAKQSGDSWFVGVLNNSVEREIKLNTAFPPAGKYTVEIWEDAKDAGKNPKNIRHLTQTLEAGKILKVKMAKAGGYVAHIKPANAGKNTEPTVYMFSYFKGNGDFTPPRRPTRYDIQGNGIGF